MKILEKTMAKLFEVFDPEVLSALLADGIIGAIVMIATIAAFFILWKVVFWITQPLFRRSKMDQTSIIFTNSLIKYALLIFGLITALDAVGIKTSAVLASLGIVGLTIGFAARDSLSNLIAGLIIYLDRPFVIGDLVEIDGNYGRVERITLRSTRIVTVDGKMLAVPNVDVLNKTVTSYTNFPHLRLDVAVTIAVDEDLDKAKKILMDLASDPAQYMVQPAPEVAVTELNDYNVMLELRVWIENEREHLAERTKLREAIFVAFNQGGIHMPYETIQLAPFHIESPKPG